jgi:hypothetical protein
MAEKEKRADWMPGKREDQLSMGNVLFTVLSKVVPAPGGGSQTNATAWGVPGELVMALDVQSEKCVVLLRKLEDPSQSTPVVREQCATAFVLLRHIMRELHAFFYLSTFPVEALARLGLTPHDDTPSAHPKPEIHVGSEIKILAYGHVEVTIWVEESGEQRIPANMGGVVLFTRMSDTPITETSDLHESKLYTTHRFVLDFPQELRGKTVYYSLCWQNGRGNIGPYSLIGSFTIP